MKSTYGFRGLVVLCAVALMAAWGASCSRKGNVAETPEQFEADVFVQAEGDSFTGKIYVNKDKTRTEMPGAVVIARMDKDVVWMLMDGMKAYTEIPVEREEHAPVGVGKVPGEKERKAVGEESIGDRKAEKFEVVSVQDGNEEIILQWVDVKNGVPIKTAAKDGSWSQEYRNAKIGAQPAELFEIPEGYRKLEMPPMPEGFMVPAPGAEGAEQAEQGEEGSGD